jgi:predicted dinucleotide-binding enzyme
MNIGILGSGDVGKSLAKGFLKIGDQVMIGSRSPEKLADFAKESSAKAGTFEATAKFGQMIVLATHGMGTLEAVDLAGKNFDGKVVIDATNPLKFEPGKLPALAISGDDSLGERVQRALPSARVVKAFNTVGNSLFVNPQLPGGPPDMFLCGNDAEGKKQVTELCRKWGWDVIDIGGIDGSRYLEAMCMTWVLHGILSGGWNHAFKMLHG